MSNDRENVYVQLTNCQKELKEEKAANEQNIQQVLGNLNYIYVECVSLLSGIIGFTDLLNEVLEYPEEIKSLEDVPKNLVKKIDHLSKNLLHEIGDLREVANIISGKPEKYTTDISVNGLIQQSIIRIQDELDRKNTILVVEELRDLGVTKYGSQIGYIFDSIFEWVIHYIPDDSSIILNGTYDENVSERVFVRIICPIFSHSQIFLEDFIDIRLDKKWRYFDINKILSHEYSKLIGGDLIVAPYTDQGLMFTLSWIQQSIMV